MTGVRLEVHLDKPARSPHLWCPKQSDWTTLWIDPKILLPGGFSCAAENLQLTLNPATNQSRSVPGVQTRTAPGMEDWGVSGGLYPICKLQQRLQQLGYIPGEDLIEGQYDWRKVPTDWLAADEPHSWHTLKQDIEGLVAAHEGRPVVLVGVSMGAVFASSFLASHLVTSEWKASHVAALITVSGVFGGTVVAPWDVIAGHMEGFEKVLPRADVSALMHRLPSLSWLSPDPAVFGDAPVMRNTYLRRTYTAANLGNALLDAGADHAAAYWRLLRSYPPSRAPGVPVYCLYSHGLATANTVTFHKRDFDGRTDVEYADGDYTVPAASLKVCERWNQVPGHPPVVSKAWLGVVHVGMLMLQSGVDYVAQTVATLAETWAAAGAAA